MNQPVGQRVNDLLFPGSNCRKIDLWLSKSDSHGPGTSGIMDQICQVEEGFGWDTAPEEALATRTRLRVHHGHVLTQISSPKSSRISPRSTTDD